MVSDLEYYLADLLNEVWIFVSARIQDGDLPTRIAPVETVLGTHGGGDKNAVLVEVDRQPQRLHSLEALHLNRHRLSLAPMSTHKVPKCATLMNRVEVDVGTVASQGGVHFTVGTPPCERTVCVAVDVPIWGVLVHAHSDFSFLSGRGGLKRPGAS